MIHDTDDEDARASLGTLLLVAGDAVEVQWLDELRAVALIVPQDLRNPPTEKMNG